MKICLCIPTRGNAPRGFMYDLLQLVMFSTAALGPDVTIDPMFGESTYIHCGRNELAEEALKRGAAYTLWLDDDMRFPPDALVRLLERRLPLIGANYPTRHLPPESVAIKHTGFDKAHPMERLEIGENGREAVDVDALGFGCVLIDTAVFRRIPFPWFENYRDRDRSIWVGEDVDFCLKAKAAGIQPMCDEALSQTVAHIGSFEYKLDHARAIKDVVDGH